MCVPSRVLGLLLALLLHACAAGTVGDGEPGNPPPALRTDASAAVSTVDAGAPAAADAAPLGFIEPDGVAQSVVAVLMIDVGGKPLGTTAKTPGRVRVIEDHDGTLTGLASRPVTLDTEIGIAVRGNYTAGLPKKPYSLELRDAAGADRDASLLGMPPGSDWVLNPSYLDFTFLRNPLVYSLARELGRYASRVRFAEVYIDGQYRGLYIVQEAIRRGRYRVPIQRPGVDATGDLTGGYIFRLEGPGKGGIRDWTSALGVLWTYHYPKAEEITDPQKAYLQDWVDRFETMMKGNDFGDAAKGYRAWIDVPSWVDFALIQELTKNFDSYQKSHYFHKQPDSAGGKLHAGPVWDFDNSLGLADLQGAYMPSGILRVKLPQFWMRLFADAAFQREMKCRWLEVRKTVITMDNVERKIDAWTRLIAGAQERDAARWKTLGTKPFPNYFVGDSYAAYVQYLRTWIAERLAWMDANLPGACARP